MLIDFRERIFNFRLELLMFEYIKQTKRNLGASAGSYDKGYYMVPTKDKIL